MDVGAFISPAISARAGFGISGQGATFDASVSLPFAANLAITTPKSAVLVRAAPFAALNIDGFQKRTPGSSVGGGVELTVTPIGLPVGGSVGVGYTTQGMRFSASVDVYVPSIGVGGIPLLALSAGYLNIGGEHQGVLGLRVGF